MRRNFTERPAAGIVYICKTRTHCQTRLIHLFPNSEQPQGDNGSGDPLPGGITDADIDSNWDEAIDSFDGMEIPEELLRGIYAYGFEKPSAIQQRAIKPTMLGRDLIAQAQSGTVSL
jgi:hypothetical protein